MHKVVRRVDAGDADLIRLEGDEYLSVDYEDEERIGVVGVSWNTEMQAGGNVTNATWLMPGDSADAIVAAMVADR